MGVSTCVCVFVCPCVMEGGFCPTSSPTNLQQQWAIFASRQKTKQNTHAHDRAQVPTPKPNSEATPERLLVTLLDINLTHLPMSTNANDALKFEQPR